MNAHSRSGPKVPRSRHRTNRLLAALEPDDFACLEPYLETIILPAGTVLYEAGEPLRHAYFPHDSVVALVAVMQDGRSAEMAVIGREAVVGFISAMASRQSFGRYIIQTPARHVGLIWIACTRWPPAARRSANCSFGLPKR
jgi:CRP-like cAMP-binding protein